MFKEQFQNAKEMLEKLLKRELNMFWMIC